MIKMRTTQMSLICFTHQKALSTKYVNKMKENTSDMYKNIKITEIKDYIWSRYLSKLNEQSDSKSKTKNYVLFSDLYSKIVHDVSSNFRNINVHTLFLTILHLANEKDFVIANIGEEIKISKN